MEGSKIYFAACLLSTLYTVCTSYCPSQLYENCSRYYNAFEHALLKDQNKYQLHEGFFPSSHSEPLYGYVYYTVNGQYYANMFWSSSFLLTYIDPIAINGLQLGLMEFLLVRTGVLYDRDSNKYYVKIMQLTLTLDLDMDIPDEAADVLMDFTSWVSSYLPGLLQTKTMAVIDKEVNTISLNTSR